MTHEESHERDARLTRIADALEEIALEDPAGELEGDARAHLLTDHLSPEDIHALRVLVAQRAAHGDEQLEAMKAERDAMRAELKRREALKTKRPKRWWRR